VLSLAAAARQGTHPEKDLQKSPDAREGLQDPAEEVSDPNGPVMVHETVREVDIDKNGMVTVRETIDTVSQGVTNKSFPDVFSYLYFFRRNAPFQVLKVKCNGKPVPSSGRFGERRIFATLGTGIGAGTGRSPKAIIDHLQDRAATS